MLPVEFTRAKASGLRPTSAKVADGTLPSLDSLMSSPVSVSRATSPPRMVLFRMSRPRISLFRTSPVRIVLFLISRLSIEPVASPYETPPSDTNRARRATTIDGDGRRRIRIYWPLGLVERRRAELDFAVVPLGGAVTAQCPAAKLFGCVAFMNISAPSGAAPGD